jgi:hypothetical protein
MFPESEAFKKFELQKEKKISELNSNYPKIVLENLFD